MVCHQCGKPVDPAQQFCASCGASLRGVTDLTQRIPPAATPPATEPTEEWAAHSPAWATTGTVPATTTAGADTPRSSLDSVPDLTGPPDADVWALTSETYGAAAPDVVVDPVRTTEMPVYQTVIAAPARPFHFSAVMLCGVLAAIVALAGTFTTAVQITSDTRLVPTATAPADFRTGTWMLDDLADNMSIAILIAAVLLVIGGVAAGFRWNWGSGLAGGAGLALTGLVALAIGLAQFPIDAAREFAAIPNEDRKSVV